jgi:hypothetical protein
MRKSVWVLGLVVALVAGGAVHADGAADAKAIIEKGIQAKGGAELLNKLKAETIKAKGKFFGMGEDNPIEYTSEVNFQAPNKYRLQVDAGAFKIGQVVNGNKGWSDFNGDVNEMSKDQLEEAQEEVYALNVARLVGLTGDGYTLSPLGESKLGAHAAVGVKVAHKGHRDISLFFDKDSGLLIGIQRKGKDIMAGGVDYTSQTILSDYKKVDGVQVPFKTIAKRDDKKYVEFETTQAKLAESLDDKVFAKP